MTLSLRICLVRHGETDWNAQRRLQGHTDIPLNHTGRAQAEATAALLAPLHFDAAYTSDLSRAADTALAIGRRRGLDATPLAALRERHYGAFQGLTYDEARARHPAAYAHFEARTPDVALPDGGESLRAFAARITGALDTLVCRHAGQQILVVAHGGVLDIVHRIASGRALHLPRDFKIPNAALNWIRHDAPDTWVIERWAEQAHLDRARDELPNS
ncbi:histidine phosphatase family protein [Denitromonas iodatirespirans]|uniref:Histidine phosphatase family protein n=1 Tax=Denitromonas iodatirespirans TaxID=2795389 RepID=A0A944D5Z5_DENI1|nr:histidine phosphatase family protein [Denitromonas iodatirespirans]MBT0960485.1 histidine phosphatase family protein [Denitromonas iodatirespirans]